MLFIESTTLSNPRGWSLIAARLAFQTVLADLAAAAGASTSSLGTCEEQCCHNEVSKDCIFRSSRLCASLPDSSAATQQQKAASSSESVEGS
jgi:hypothetical protein